MEWTLSLEAIDHVDKLKSIIRLILKLFGDIQQSVDDVPGAVAIACSPRRQRLPHSQQADDSPNAPLFLFQ